MPVWRVRTNGRRSGRGWAKLSAPYRTSLQEPPYRDITPFAHALVAAAPDRLVWGSDWPHVLLEKTMPDDGKRGCRSVNSFSMEDRTSCGEQYFRVTARHPTRRSRRIQV